MGRALFTSTPKNTPAPFPVQQMRELFESCDANGDGKLSKPELRAAFNKLGALIPRFRAHQGMAVADGNGDGFIDLDDNELEDLIKFALSFGYKLK